MHKPDLVILGGGPAGLATAYYAQQQAISCLLLEKESSPGGLCRTIRFGNHRYDLGAHRFHDRNPEVTADVARLLDGHLREVSAPSKIYRWRRFIDFPPTPLNLLSSVPPTYALAIAWDLLRARIRRKSVQNFEDYCVNAFGRTLAKTLLIDYSQKLWGEPANRLSPAVATRRLSGISVASLLLELFGGSRKTTHLDGHFLYPEEGYGAITDALCNHLQSGTVVTNSAVTRLDHLNGKIQSVLHRGGCQELGDRGIVVSTLPVSLLVRMLHPPPEPEVLEAAKRLKFRHLRLIYLRLEQARFSEQSSIYIPDPEICVTRITEPKNRSPKMAPAHETGIAVEVPCSDGEAISELPTEDLVDRVRNELRQNGLLEPSRVLDWQHHFLPNAYPVYDLDYRNNVQQVLEGVKRLGNLWLVGRQGLFFYSHLHDQFQMGRDLVKLLVPSSEP